MRPIKTKIQIKTENDIRRRIKIEPESPNQLAINNLSQNQQTLPIVVAPKATEKQVLIEKIATLQKENQRIVHTSLKDKEKHRKIDQENSKKIRSLTTAVSDLRNQLKMAQSTIENSTRNSDKTISDLRAEIRSLQAHVKQLQSTPNVNFEERQQMLNSKISDSDDETDEVFEVERLIRHGRLVIPVELLAAPF